MKNKILIGVVIVLSVLVLLMGGYIIYDKSNDEVLDNKNDFTEKEDNNKVQDKVNETKDVKVVDAKVIKEDERIVKNISIPKLVIDNVEISAFNQKIEQDILDNFDDVEKYNVDEKHYTFSSNYNYLIFGNLVSILIDAKIEPWPGSGNGEKVYSYFYDLENNKQVNSYEALLMSGYTDSDIMDIAKECLTSTPDGMPAQGSCEFEYVKSVLEKGQLDNGSSFSIENGKLKLNWYESAI